MFASALIVFREVLEAALVVSVVMAATRGVTRRGFWVAGGILAGVVGSGIVAALASTIADSVEGTGQEILNAAILFTVVALLAWHVSWMSVHGREMAAQMRQVGAQVAEGARHMSMLTVIIGLAVTREGAEVALMLQGLFVGTEVAPMLTGAFIGLGAGVLAGLAIYAGFVALPVGRMFALTNWLLILIAAGMAARGANYLVQAGWLPSLGTRLWDTSHILSEQSLVGEFMATLVGYIARPNGVQALSYALTVAGIAGLMNLVRRKYRPGRGIATACVAMAAMMAFVPVADASSVKSPRVVQGEFEIEHEGVYKSDSVSSKDGAREFEFAAAYAFTPFWKTELEFELEGEADEKVKHTVTKWENTFQLAQPGEFYVDPALYVELALGANGDTNNVTSGVILGKDIAKTSNLLNLLIQKDIGSRAREGYAFRYNWQTVYQVKPWFEPGFELFGNTNRASDFDRQKLDIGPLITGYVPGFANGQKVKYELGYLFGATDTSPDGTLKWKLEYEFFL